MEGVTDMIKIKNQNPNQPPRNLESKGDDHLMFPGDIIVADYILKEISTCGTMENFAITLAEKLSQAAKSGYKYVDRIPANSTESIMIFTKIDL